MTTECPTCGREDFESEKGLKIHHQKSHNKPLGGANYFCDSCSSSFTEVNGLAKHYNKNPEHRESGTTCPSCGNNYEQLGKHWRSSEACRVAISDEAHEVLTGILMGDGAVQGKNNTGNPSIKIEMKNRKYLSFLSNTFPTVFTGTVSENRNSTYTIRTISHPGIETYADWYSSGEKVFPEDIDLTPRTLKHWYVCDGSLNRSGQSVGNPRIIIYMSNEHKNTDKIDSYFESVGLPTPSNYLTRERERHYNSDTHISCAAQFSVEQSEELWSYMGKPVPGFERKWPDQNS